ncbi:hypothetical protein QE152_g35843 [Popillia japonica]|uniref:Uncharacterized protein n=1 Tax=Popillia japonica TaxID=7064 RepID=A0AAW1IEQ5_POPJA
MELNKKYFLCLNVLLFALQAICSTDPPTLASSHPDIKNEVQPSNLTNTNIENNSNDEVDDKNKDVEDTITSTESIPPLNPEDETKDLQQGGNFENLPKTTNEDDEVILPIPVDNDQQGPTSQIEWIEEEKDEEHDPDLPPVVEAMVDVTKEDTYRLQGQMGIVVALFLIVLLVVGYMTFVVWRRFIERRYDNRQILVNEEDMIDPTDMKHFSL